MLSFGLKLAPSGVSPQGKASAVEDVPILAHDISGSSNACRESDPGFGSSAASSHSINDRGPMQLRPTRIDGAGLRAEYWILLLQPTMACARWAGDSACPSPVHRESGPHGGTPRTDQ